MRLNKEVEKYLKGLYKIRISNATMLSYQPPEQSEFLRDTVAVKKYLKETRIVFQTIEIIADMLYNGHDVTIINKEMIPVIYERVEAYLEEGAKFYNQDYMDEQLREKMEKLENLNITLFNKFKKRIVIYIEGLDDSKKKPVNRTNFIDFLQTSNVNRDKVVDGFERESKLKNNYVI